MSSLVASVGLLLSSSILFVVFLQAKGKTKEEKARDETNSTPVPTPLKKEQVLQLRSKHFSTRVSVSYANSGPLMIVKGEGARLMDEQGTWYLDTRNNVAHCGHSHPHVVQAVQRQIATLNTNTRYLHPNVCLLAKRLSNRLPDPLEVVFFVNSGSEANDLALRLARAYTGSNNTIVVEGAYHGHTLATLQVSPYKYEHSAEFSLEPPMPGISSPATPARHVWKVPCPDVYRGPHRDWDTAGAQYARYVEEACDAYVKTTVGGKVGAFIIEGGMSVAGVLLPPPTYLQRCVIATRDAGGVWIADEVQTGFGRFGKCFWAFQYQHVPQEEQVVPDIVTLGKPFGNGMPLAAVVTTRKIAQAFESMGVEYFNTFGGNPVSAAAGLAVLDIIESECLQENADIVGNHLKSGFLELQKRLDIIGDVRGSGLFLGIELVRDRETLEPASTETSFLCTVLKQKYAILTSIDGLNDNVLVVKPPMVFSISDADLFLMSFEKAVREDLTIVEDFSSIATTPT